MELLFSKTIIKTCFIFFQDSSQLNRTVSTLRLTPQPEDHGVVFTCRVENPSLPNSVLEENYKLNVHCKYLTIIYIGQCLLLMPCKMPPL